MTKGKPEKIGGVGPKYVYRVYCEDCTTSRDFMTTAIMLAPKMEKQGWVRQKNGLWRCANH